MHICAMLASVGRRRYRLGMSRRSTSLEYVILRMPQGYPLSRSRNTYVPCNWLALHSRTPYNVLWSISSSGSEGR
jgi:hypothetical protein